MPPHLQSQNAECSERATVACAQSGDGGGGAKHKRPTSDLGTRIFFTAAYVNDSHTLDVFQSDDEDVHQHHLCLPAGAFRDGVDQVVVDLLGGLVVQLLRRHKSVLEEEEV